MPLEVRLEDLVRLELITSDEAFDSGRKNIQKLAKKLQKAGIIKNYRESTGLFLMAAQASGDCQFLNDRRLCDVYEKRPEVCRKFPQLIGLRPGFCPYLKKK
jgi:Fe-S-cluster containining protein